MTKEFGKSVCDLIIKHATNQKEDTIDKIQVDREIKKERNNKYLSVEMYKEIMKETPQKIEMDEKLLFKQELNKKDISEINEMIKTIEKRLKLLNEIVDHFWCCYLSYIPIDKNKIKSFDIMMRSSNSDALFKRNSMMKNTLFYLHKMLHQKKMMAQQDQQKKFKDTKLNDQKIMSTLRNLHVKQMVENMVKAKIKELKKQNSICKLICSIHEVDVESQLFWKRDTQKLREPDILYELLKFIIVKSGNHQLVFFVDIIKIAYPVEQHQSMNIVSAFFEIDDLKDAFTLVLTDNSTKKK